MTSREQDEQLLIDFLLGRTDEQTAEQVRRRMESDESFSALQADIANTFSALATYPASEPPEDLVERTMARIRAARRAEALLAAVPAEPEARRPVFSFRELAALAAAVLVAVGILVPSLVHARRDMHRTLCAGNVRIISSAMNHYASGNDKALPSAPVRAEAWLFSPGAKFASNSAALFLLVRNNYAAPEVFQCPAAGGRSFVLKAGMIDFPSPWSIGYSYQHSLDGPMRQDDPELARVADRKVVLGDDNPVFSGGRFLADRVHRRVSENHNNTGQNVLRLDGEVFWATDADVGVDGDNIWLVKGIFRYTGTERPTSKLDTFLVPRAGQ